MRIRWTSPAAAALEAVVDYIAQENPKAAYEIALRIRVAVSQISEHPKLGRAGRIRGTYELVINNTPYIVAYRFKNKEIDILSVYHSSRRWPDSFKV